MGLRGHGNAVREVSGCSPFEMRPYDRVSFDDKLLQVQRDSQPTLFAEWDYLFVSLSFPWPQVFVLKSNPHLSAHNNLANLLWRSF